MKIAILEPLAITEEILEEKTAVFTDAGHEIISYPDRNADPAVLIERAEGAEIVVIANLPFPAKVINSLPDLKMVSVAFTGVDHIDIKACKAKGIAVSNSAGYATQAVAEHALGLILGLLRFVPACDRAVRAGKDRTGLIGSEIGGKIVGIVGTGAIGTRTAELLKPFGCRILGYNRSQRDEFKEAGGEYCSLEDLLSQSDIISLHVPLTDETRGLINQEKIALMKKGAYLVNTARGPVLDSDAAAQALRSGHLAGAGFDVFETEPPFEKGHILFDAPNVIAAPHVAFATREAFIRRADIVFSNISAWLDGNQINVIC